MMDLDKKFYDKQHDLANMSESPPFPKIIKIDTNNSCNYRCLFCPQSNQTTKHGPIDSSLCNRILEESYDAGARECALSGTGEPLLNRRLEEHIFHAKKIGYEYVFINTNGYLATEDRVRTLLDSGLDSIKFSINSARRRYALVHGVDGFDRVINNLATLKEYRDKAGSSCRIYVSFVATKYTCDEINEIRRVADRLADGFLAMNANNLGGRAGEVDDQLYAGADRHVIQYPCSKIFNNVYVSAEGYMLTCSQDFVNEAAVADLNTCSVVEAWNGKMFVEFRRRYLNRALSGTICARCLRLGTEDTVTPLSKNVQLHLLDSDLCSDMQGRIQELDRLHHNS